MTTNSIRKILQAYPVLWGNMQRVGTQEWSPLFVYNIKPEFRNHFWRFADLLAKNIDASMCAFWPHTPGR